MYQVKVIKKDNEYTLEVFKDTMEYFVTYVVVTTTLYDIYQHLDSTLGVCKWRFINENCLNG